MRFLLFDRVTHLEPGRRIEGIKTISLTEECFRGHYPRRPLFPSSLVVESMVQLTAWCAIAKHDFAVSLVLSVLEDVRLPPDLPPGVRLDLSGELLGTNPKGSMARARAVVDGEEVASIGRLLYAHVPIADPEVMRARFAYYGGGAP